MKAADIVCYQKLAQYKETNYRKNKAKNIIRKKKHDIGKHDQKEKEKRTPIDLLDIQLVAWHGRKDVENH